MKRLIAAALLLTMLSVIACAPVLAESKYRIYLTDEYFRERDKYTTLEKGDRGSEVMRMQQRLAELGYLEDEDVDGIFGQVTSKALNQFCLSNWFQPPAEDPDSPDFRAYPLLQYKLFHKFAVPASGFQMNVPLDENSSRFDIERVERRLCDTGYLSDGDVDGVFDAITAGGIFVFEIENGLNPDGVADAEMLMRLFSFNMVSCPEDES